MPKLFLSLVLGSICLIAIAYWVQEFRSQSNPSTQSSMIVKGTQVKGALLKSFDEQGRSLTLKISDVELDPKDSEKETYLYTVFYQDPTNSKWRNLCLPDPDNVAKAIPLSGRWDETGTHIDDGEITFACTSGVLAKCVRWGYKPWKTVEGRSLRDFHQACTRMARADYCGNGIGHTQDGTPIDVYDKLGLLHRTKESGMVFEAAWGKDGAVFIHRTRWTESLTQLQKECPAKSKHLIHKDTPVITEAEIQKLAPTALIFNDSFDEGAN